MNIERGKVWNQFLVSSVLASLCRNKGTQSDLGPHFCPGPPRPGSTGGPSSGSAPQYCLWRNKQNSFPRNKK